MRGQRLSLRPGVEGVSDFLRQRAIPHLQEMRPRHAEAVAPVIRHINKSPSCERLLLCGRATLFDLDITFADDLAPALGLRFDVAAEILGRAERQGESLPDQSSVEIRR